MFDLVRRLTHNADAPTADTEVRVLAITARSSEWESLGQISNRCGWKLFWANSCDAALAFLASNAIPVVICDRDLPGEDWRVVVQQIGAFRQPTCILLASSVSDEYLWREVVQHQGFDVLPKPFQPERLIRIVNLAWSWCGWMNARSGQKRAAT